MQEHHKSNLLHAFRIFKMITNFVEKVTINNTYTNCGPCWEFSLEPEWWIFTVNFVEKVHLHCVTVHEPRVSVPQPQTLSQALTSQ